MNKERILALADLISKQPHTGEEDDFGFTMENFTHDCGTPACIGGFALAMQHDEFTEKLFDRVANIATSLAGQAGDYLGLSADDAHTLFYPPDFNVGPKGAARVLRNLAKTGKVDWSAS